MTDPDITKLPVLPAGQKMAVRLLRCPSFIQKIPIHITRNVGMYRMQVFGPTLTGMHWHKHKVSAKHFNEYKKLDKRMPVAVHWAAIRSMPILPQRHFLKM